MSEEENLLSEDGINGNIGTLTLQKVDLEKTIGSANRTIQLIVERMDKNSVRFSIHDESGKIGPAFEEVKIDNIARRFIKTDIYGELLVLLGSNTQIIRGKETGILKTVHRNMLTVFLDNLHGAWRQTRFIQSARSADPLSVRPTTEKEKEGADVLLCNPFFLDVVDNELSFTIKGERANRLYVFLSLVQSFTDDYPQIILIGESSIGKTWIINRVLDIFPQEMSLKVGRLSKTALERMKSKLEHVKILYVQEARGKQAAADSIRLSSSSDGGMVAIVTNVDTGEVDEFRVPPLTLITSQTELELHHEDETRMVKVYLDATEAQTKEVIDYQAKQAEWPVELLRSLHVFENSRAREIKTAIRKLKKDYKIIIPYQTLVAEVLDTSKVRIKRDHKKIIGNIKASAILFQYQRKILKIDDSDWIIANDQDLKNALMYGEKPITQSFYNIDDLGRELLTLIHGLTTKTTTDWVEGNEIFEGGIHTDAIVREVEKILGYKRTWTTDRLKTMYDNSVITREYRKFPDGGKKNGNYYLAPLTEYTSILDKPIEYAKIQERMENWEKELVERNQGGIIRLGRMTIDENFIEDTLTDSGSTDSTDSEPITL